MDTGLSSAFPLAIRQRPKRTLWRWRIVEKRAALVLKSDGPSGDKESNRNLLSDRKGPFVRTERPPRLRRQHLVFVNFSQRRLCGLTLCRKITWMPPSGIDLASSPTRIAFSAKSSSRLQASIRIKSLDN